MAARGRKQKVCLLKQNLGETLDIHLTDKTTGKRQNFDPSRPPACAEHHHFTLNGETRRAPGCHQMQVPRWLGKTQTTRGAKRYMVLPQTTLGQISIAP
jgi:hypothetical protein